jgi:hypothetical protein
MARHNTQCHTIGIAAWMKLPTRENNVSKRIWENDCVCERACACARTCIRMCALVCTRLHGACHSKSRTWNVTTARNSHNSRATLVGVHLTVHTAAAAVARSATKSTTKGNVVQSAWSSSQTKSALHNLRGACTAYLYLYLSLSQHWLGTRTDLLFYNRTAAAHSVLGTGSAQAPLRVAAAPAAAPAARAGRARRLPAAQPRTAAALMSGAPCSACCLPRCRRRC